MERLAIKRKEDLPYLIEKLRESNSPVVRDWNREFNPTLNYRTSINMMDVRIEFWGDYWEESYRLFSLFSEEYGWDMTVQNYIWLSENTEIVNKALYGNSEFNEYIMSNGAEEELIEFVKMHPLMSMAGEDIELLYTERYMDMLNDLGMYFANNKYLYRSNKGYYLPVGFKVIYGNELDWVRDVNVFKKKDLEIVHNPQVEVRCLNKGIFYRLAKDLYQNFGLYELIISWVDEPYEEEYEITIGNVKVKVVDVWKKGNKEYMKAARYLKSISDKELEAYKVKDIIEHSNWIDGELNIDEEYYKKIGVPKEKVVKGYNKIREGVYSTGDTELGKKDRLKIQFDKMTMYSPYELVQEGKYREPLIPLTRPDLAEDNKEELDRDIRLVLGYRGKQEDKEDSYTRKEKYLGEDTKKSLEQYPSVDIKDEDLPEIKIEEEKELQKELTGGLEDLLNIPYVESYQKEEDMVVIYYRDGKIVRLRGLGEQAVDLEERVLFRDSIGLDYKESTKRLVKMLMSLATDKLEYVSLEEESEEFRELVKEIIDEWLEVLINKDSGRLIQLVEDLQDEVVKEEDIDIFSEFEFFT